MQKQAVGTVGLLALLVLMTPSPASAQAIKVSSATPNTAVQGTINLDVTVNGNGYKHGAKAHWFVTGTTDPGGVSVNTTTFVSSNQLIANITVATDATIDFYDVQVQNADGRTGVGIDAFTVKSNNATNNDPLARADFLDAGVLGSPAGSAVTRIQSDGNGLPSACGAYDYADRNDTCQAGDGGVRSVGNNGSYFLRTLWSPDPNPTRWLVLDFTDVLSGSCPGLDTKLKSYPGRNPAAFSPEDPNPCVDLLEVRFFLDKAYALGAVLTPVRIIIDGPDIWPQSSTGNQWNTKYQLDFVNPSSITLSPTDSRTITVTTIPGLEQAELWTINPKNGKKQTKLGTYRMPFQVKITTLP